jgi:hypothetical protein
MSFDAAYSGSSTDTGDTTTRDPEERQRIALEEMHRSGHLPTSYANKLMMQYRSEALSEKEAAVMAIAQFPALIQGEVVDDHMSEMTDAERTIFKQDVAGMQDQTAAQDFGRLHARNEEAYRLSLDPGFIGSVKPASTKRLTSHSKVEWGTHIDLGMTGCSSRASLTTSRTTSSS